MALYVQDLAQAKGFFEKYFGGVAGEKYHNPETGLQTCFVAFGNGARLELMTRPSLLQPPAAGFFTGYTHLTFKVSGGRPAVYALAGRLAADGYRVTGGPRETGDGYYVACVEDAEGNQIELMA